MTATTMYKAWEKAKEIANTGFTLNEWKTKRAGYKVYDAADESGTTVSDLNTRLELNIADGRTFNIWIEEDNKELLEREITEAIDFYERHAEMEMKRAERMTEGCSFRCEVEKAAFGNTEKARAMREALELIRKYIK